MTLNPALVESARFWAHRSPLMPAAKRLENARADLANGKRRYPGPVKPYAAVQWADAATNRNERAGALAYVNATEPDGLRFVGYVDSESRRFHADCKHLGWYADSYYQNCAVGVVYALPGKGRNVRLVAGFVFTDFDGGPTLDMGEIFESPAIGYGYDASDTDAARDAARAANHMAERAAERERDYQAASGSGFHYAEAGERIAEAKREIHALLAERKAALRAGSATGFTAICAAITRDVSRLVAEIHAARAERAKLAAGEFEPLYWFPGDSDLLAAFNEAAGLNAA